MTTTDSNGVIRYQTTDPVSPLHTLLNLGMQSVSDAIGPFVGDTGWLPITSLPGTTSGASVRSKGGILYFKGTFTATSGNYTNGTTSLGTLPPNIRLDSAMTEDSIRQMTSFTASGVPIEGAFGYVTAAGVVTMYVAGGLPIYPNRILPTALSGVIRSA